MVMMVRDRAVRKKEERRRCRFDHRQARDICRMEVMLLYLQPFTQRVMSENISPMYKAQATIKVSREWLYMATF
jgi:hypothetical protein